jgi:hypothetical protein
VVEARRLQLHDARFVQADARRDQVGVEAQAVRLCDERCEVLARQGLAAG